jgi:hypothetical protein
VSLVHESVYVLCAVMVTVREPVTPVAFEMLGPFTVQDVEFPPFQLMVTESFGRTEDLLEVIESAGTVSTVTV